MFLMSALALSGVVTASASEALYDAYYVDTNTTDNGYQYTQVTSYKLNLSSGDGDCGTNYAQSQGWSRSGTIQTVDLNGLSIDFSKDARYEITFGANFFVNNPVGGQIPCVNLTMVSKDNTRTLMFGNSNDDLCQVGWFSGDWSEKTNGLKYLGALSSEDTNVWTAAGGVVSTGFCEFKIVFETFADPNIHDQIDYSITRNGQTTSFTRLSSDDMTHNIGSLVFDDIGFTVVGANFPAGMTEPANGENGVTLLSYYNGKNVGTYTEYSRAEVPQPEPEPPAPDVPEPSAFGLLAGLGAIALAMSRRRRSR